MSLLQRHTLFMIVVSFVVGIFLIVVAFFAFPLPTWTELLEKTILDIPFLLALPVMLLVIGSLFGMVSGLYWRKKWQQIESSIKQLQQGVHVNAMSIGTKELDNISHRLLAIDKQITEQRKQAQKLANEKAEDQAKQVQQLVSQERNRLARELHDSVSQQLFAASMLMSAITETTDRKDSKQLSMVEKMIQQAQLEMRALLLHLRPVALKGKTLKAGVEELLMELIQKVPLAITWKVEEMKLDKGIEDHLFRILQESVSNTLRHAKATSLNVLLIERNDMHILRVEDDGVGFDVEETKAGSYGLHTMKERAVELGGSLKIISLLNQGTKLEVRIPKLTNGGEEND
ncbi:sensor histidine kinase [Bacillus sp. 2205SS5-2]|uniref:sensor histidine kinase n=1 Tax=Bacillus sp. 2205SS5-2 TaxID=3109031 RepID=UPI0030065E46